MRIGLTSAHHIAHYENETQPRFMLQYKAAVEGWPFALWASETDEFINWIRVFNSMQYISVHEKLTRALFRNGDLS